jgi:hypothetical protein
MPVTEPSGIALKSTEMHSDKFWLEPRWSTTTLTTVVIVFSQRLEDDAEAVCDQVTTASF